MACSLPALFKLCTEKALKEDPEMPIPASDKFLCRYLYPRTAAAAAAVSSSESLLEIRWALQQKILEKPNPDSYYNMSQYKYLKTFAVKLGNDKVTMIATDDKAGIDVGEPGLPIVACQHPGKSWIPSQLRLGEGQHTFHKFNLTPSVRLVHDLPAETDGSFYRGRPQLTLKDAVFEPSSGARHFTELSKSLDLNVVDKKPVAIITNDGGPDHNIHHDRNKAALLAFFLNNPHILFLANFQIAAHRSAFHPVEKLNCIINLALNGVALSRDELSDPNFEKILKSCSSMLDIRKSAETNPGLVHQVFECLKTSKEVVEARVKLASLKENNFEVYESATRAEIENFMSILNTVDPNFNVSEFLDTKKKFHITGSLQDYFKEVATDCYYCITLMRHNNMSAEFLNSLSPNLNLPFDLHPIPCPVKDIDNPDKYMTFEQVYFSDRNRSYNDIQRPGRSERKTHNIPFPKSIVRALYCSRLNVICSGCNKRRVVYTKYKPTHCKIEQAKTFLESMRYECGASLDGLGTEGFAAVAEVAGLVLEDGRGNGQEDPATLDKHVHGEESIFNTFFMDESLSCSSPVEKHLYEILPNSMTSSHPCYYCGETDMAQTSDATDREYPLCDYCRNTKKIGQVLKRKKRTIVPREKKRKNKSKKDEDYIEFFDQENDEQEVGNEGVLDINSDYENITDEEVVEETKSDDEESDSTWPSLPASPDNLASVEDLLGSDTSD